MKAKRARLRYRAGDSSDQPLCMSRQRPILIPHSRERRLQQLANEHGVSFQDMARFALDFFFEQQEEAVSLMLPFPPMTMRARFEWTAPHSKSFDTRVPT